MIAVSRPEHDVKRAPGLRNDGVNDTTSAFVKLAKKIRRLAC